MHESMERMYSRISLLESSSNTVQPAESDTINRNGSKTQEKYIDEQFVVFQRNMQAELQDYTQSNNDKLFKVVRSSMSESQKETSAMIHKALEAIESMRAAVQTDSKAQLDQFSMQFAETGEQLQGLTTRLKNIEEVKQGMGLIEEADSKARTLLEGSGDWSWSDRDMELSDREMRSEADSYELQGQETPDGSTVLGEHDDEQSPSSERYDNEREDQFRQGLTRKQAANSKIQREEEHEQRLRSIMFTAYQKREEEDDNESPNLRKDNNRSWRTAGEEYTSQANQGIAAGTWHNPLKFLEQVCGLTKDDLVQLRDKQIEFMDFNIRCVREEQIERGGNTGLAFETFHSGKVASSPTTTDRTESRVDLLAHTIAQDMNKKISNISVQTASIIEQTTRKMVESWLCTPVTLRTPKPDLSTNRQVTKKKRLTMALYAQQNNMYHKNDKHNIYSNAKQSKDCNRTPTKRSNTGIAVERELLNSTGPRVRWQDEAMMSAELFPENLAEFRTPIQEFDDKINPMKKALTETKLGTVTPTPKKTIDGLSASDNYSKSDDVGQEVGEMQSPDPLVKLS
jgi:hypothetical protein